MRGFCAVLAGLLALALAGGVYLARGAGESAQPEPPAPQDEITETVAVALPELTPQELAGKAVFAEYCATCHGPHGGGVAEIGPPLVYPGYGATELSDADIVAVVRQGVAMKRWKISDMPGVVGISGDEIRAAIAYLRAVQRANGIR